MSAEVKSLVSDYLRWSESGSADKAQVEELANDEDWARLEAMMMPRVAFGTAGIRARMGPGFAQMNDLVIVQTSQGLAHYLVQAEEKARSRGVVIGFDGRHNSRRWARLAANAFLAAGFTRVLLYSRTTPTPLVPFAVRQSGAAAGVMVTASHNPKDDNGYKVFWGNGAQILSPHDKNIQSSILSHLSPSGGDAAFRADENLIQHKGLVTDPTQEMTEKYLDILQSQLHLPPRETRSRTAMRWPPVVYTAMHGVGADFVDWAVDKAGFPKVVHVAEQRDPNPDFPTVTFPNPEEGKSALDLAMKKAEEVGARYILANDPDADRLAVAEKVEGTWHVFTGNEIGSLLGWWLLQVHLKKTPGGADGDRSNLMFVASTVSSKMLAAVANKEGMRFQETLTGFKWMANKALDFESEGDGNKVLMAFEESIGFMCDGSTVPDKDGVSASIRMLELMLDCRERETTLSGQLDLLYRKYGYHCCRGSYFRIRDRTRAEGIFRRLRNWDGKADNYPSSVGRFEVSSVRDLTTGRDTASPDGHAALPKSPEMVTLRMRNGAQITVRTSGTEPKLKYYAEFCATPEQSDWSWVERELGEVVEAVTREILRPEESGLVARED